MLHFSLHSFTHSFDDHGGLPRNKTELRCTEHTATSSLGHEVEALTNHWFSLIQNKPALSKPRSTAALKIKSYILAETSQVHKGGH